MSWKLIDRPKTQKVTKSLAKSFAEMEPAPHDRPLSERRLQVYQKLLANGQFRPVTWASAICKETGEVYRVNGKHTSTMLSGMEKVPEFFVTIEEYECDELEDVAKLYATFDSAMQSRSAKDIYLSFASTVSELIDVPNKVLVAAATGMSYATLGEDTYGRSQPAERAENLLDHSDFVVWLSGLTVGGGPSARESSGTSKQRGAHLIRMPVVAAIFKCYEKARGPALEFWTAVRDDTGAAPNLPDRKLSRYLLVTSSRRDARTAKTATSGREIYVKCLHAWNAWRKSETTNLNYFQDAKIPAVL